MIWGTHEECKSDGWGENYVGQLRFLIAVVQDLRNQIHSRLPQNAPLLSALPFISSSPPASREPKRYIFVMPGLSVAVWCYLFLTKANCVIINSCKTHFGGLGWGSHSLPWKEQAGIQRLIVPLCPFFQVGEKVLHLGQSKKNERYCLCTGASFPHLIAGKLMCYPKHDIFHFCTADSSFLIAWQHFLC